MLKSLKNILGNKNFIFVVKLTLAILLVYFLILKVDWSEVWQNVINLPPFLVVFYFVLLLLGISISSYKWKKLSEFQGFGYPLKDFFSWYLTGTFINNFMPSTIGGDAYRAISLGKKDEEGYAKASSTVFIDRLTGITGLVFLTAFFSLFNWKLALEKEILLLIYAGIWVGAFVIFFVLYFKKIPYQSKLVGVMPKLITRYLKRVNDYRNRKILTKALQLALVFAFVGVAASNYVLFLAVGEVVSPISYLSVIFLISLLASIPITIGNLGVKEWAYVLFFGFFGISSSTAVTVVLLSRFLQIIVSLFGVPLYLRDKNKIKKEKTEKVAMENQNTN